MYGSCCGEARHCTGQQIYLWIRLSYRRNSFLWHDPCVLCTWTDTDDLSTVVHGRIIRNVACVSRSFGYGRRKKCLHLRISFISLCDIIGAYEIEWSTIAFRKDRKSACCCFGRNGKSGYCYWSETMGSGLPWIKGTGKEIAVADLRGSGRRI